MNITKKKSLYTLAVIIMGIMLLAGCSGSKESKPDTGQSPTAEQSPSSTEQKSAEAEKEGFTQISQEEALLMMEEQPDAIILDVRTQEEYGEGHIPNAICVPNEEITDSQPAELPDLNQTILVYCRSGNRSKQASQKLFDMGYTSVYEFGGIKDWAGDVVTD